MIHLHDLPKNDKEGTKIFVEASDGSKFVNFHHTDGLYSYCTTEKGGVVHLSVMTPLKKVKGGYKIAE